MTNANHPNPLTLTELTDEQIVQQVVSGETELFGIIVRRYNQRLFRVIRSYIPSEDDVQDIMQEAYVKAYINLPQFRNQSSVSTWLTRIAINEALLHIRKNKHHFIHELEVSGQTGQVDVISQLTDNNQIDPEKQVIKTETTHLVEQAVDLLPEKYRSVFILHQTEGMSNPEIASCLQLTEVNVKVRLYRAKKLLKEELFKMTHDASFFEFGNTKCDRMVQHVLERIGLLNLNTIESK